MDPTLWSALLCASSGALLVACDGCLLRFGGLLVYTVSIGALLTAARSQVAPATIHTRDIGTPPATIHTRDIGTQSQTTYTRHWKCPRFQVLPELSHGAYF